MPGQRLQEQEEAQQELLPRDGDGAAPARPGLADRFPQEQGVGGGKAAEVQIPAGQLWECTSHPAGVSVQGKV